MKKLRVFHLLNDFSGSPKVLRQVIKNAQEIDFEINLSTSSGRGFLSDLEGVHYQDNHYVFKSNKLKRFAFLFGVQFMVMIKTLFVLSKDDVVYINTLLPFGAAIAAKIRGVRVVYHVHESSIQPKMLLNFLKYIAKKTATEIIYVSEYVQKELALKHKNEGIIYNAIDRDFLEQRLSKNVDEIEEPQVLMVCSLKAYKGVNEFVTLAKKMPQFQFKLVLNATQKEVDAFLDSVGSSSNLKCYAKQENLHPFYSKADVVLNLSHPNLWVETFGLTVLEAMCYGIPTIVPPVGGVTELVDHQKTRIVYP